MHPDVEFPSLPWIGSHGDHPEHLKPWICQIFSSAQSRGIRGTQILSAQDGHRGQSLDNRASSAESCVSFVSYLIYHDSYLQWVLKNTQKILVLRGPAGGGILLCFWVIFLLVLWSPRWAPFWIELNKTILNVQTVNSLANEWVIVVNVYQFCVMFLSYFLLVVWTQVQ